MLLSMATGYALGEVGCRRMHVQDLGVCSANVYPPIVFFPPSSVHTPNDTFITFNGTADIR